jgi:hypothetical protein
MADNHLYMGVMSYGYNTNRRQKVDEEPFLAAFIHRWILPKDYLDV